MEPVVQSAVTQIDRGDVRAAAATVRQGLQQAPDHPDLLHLGGQVALRVGDAAQGKQLIREAIRRAPRVGLYHYNLGSILLIEGALDAARASLQQAVRHDSTLVDAYTNLGIVCVRLRQQADAEAAFREAAKRQPGNPQLHLNLAICNMELRRPDDAEQAVVAAVRASREPDAKFLHEVGNCYRGLGRHLVAERYYRDAIALDAGHVDAWFALGDVLSSAGDYDGALQALQRVRALDGEGGRVRLPMARVLANRGDIAAARALLAEACEAAGDDLSLIVGIAREYTLIGDFDAQERCLRHVLAIQPGHVDAIVALAVAPGRKLDDADADRLRRLADDGRVSAATRTAIGFALGDYHRHAGQYDEAFRWFRHGNRLKGYRFDRGAHAAWVEQMRGVFTPAYFAERAGWGSDSRLPVLIVGLPRSGTTLTEQVLSAHPLVLGAGEYGGVAALAGLADVPVPDFRVRPDLAAALDRDTVARHAEAYLGRMRGLIEHGERFVSNKLPGNFLQLGLFALMFPRAPVIHVRREPRDNLLSIYFQDFAGYHDYAYDLKDLGHYHALYEELMAHWTTVLPNPVLTVRYEALVTDLPGKAADMAALLGIDVDERMLRFHEQERKVETASKWQVRQPLYTSSVARWKPYEKYLGPLFDILDPGG